MHPDAAMAYGAVVLLEGGGALCNGSILLVPPEVPEEQPKYFLPITRRDTEDERDGMSSRVLVVG